MPVYAGIIINAATVLVHSRNHQLSQTGCERRCAEVWGCGMVLGFFIVMTLFKLSNNYNV